MPRTEQLPTLLNANRAVGLRDVVIAPRRTSLLLVALHREGAGGNDRCRLEIGVDRLAPRSWMMRDHLTLEVDPIRQSSPACLGESAFGVGRTFRGRRPEEVCQKETQPGTYSCGRPRTD